MNEQPSNVINSMTPIMDESCIGLIEQLGQTNSLKREQIIEIAAYILFITYYIILSGTEELNSDLKNTLALPLNNIFLSILNNDESKIAVVRFTEMESIYSESFQGQDYENDMLNLSAIFVSYVFGKNLELAMKDHGVDVLVVQMISMQHMVSAKKVFNLLQSEYLKTHNK